MGMLLKRFASRISLTLLLIVLESAGWILFPLVIGRAIDGILADSWHGLYELAILGIAAMGIAILRRIVDSRAYARIYAKLGEELVAGQTESSTSTKTARLGMLREIVEFLENSLPELILNVLQLAGVVLILSTLDLPIFVGCVVVICVTVAVYVLTGRLTTRFNRSYNDQYEQQVDAVESGDAARVGRHIRDMMRWNIKLSDLEAANYGIVWLFMIALLVFSIGAAAEGIVEYGKVFAIVMYVFQFMEAVMALPLYYQQWLRLREISGRLTAMVAPPPASTEAPPAAAP